MRRLEGLTGRRYARRRGVRAFTEDYERMGQETFDASRQTGGWVKAAGVVAAGGAQAQSGSKCCMNSCDALHCILSVRAVSIKVARIGANCRVNSCVALLSPKKVCGWAQRVASGAAALWSCNCGCSVRQYTFVKVQRWFAVALLLRLMGTAYTMVQALARGKEQVGRRIAYFVLRKGRRDGHDTVVALAGSVPVSNGIDVRSTFRQRLKGLTGRRDAGALHERLRENV